MGQFQRSFFFILLLVLLASGVECAKEKQLSTRHVEKDLDKAVTHECVAVNEQMSRATEASRVETAKQTLRNIPGVKVMGSYHGVISLIMTPRQAQARELFRDVCHNLFRSHPYVKSSCKTPLPTRRRQDIIDTQQAVKAMLLDKVLATEPNLNGSGIKIGILSTSYFALPQPTNYPCPAVESTTVLSEIQGLDGANDEGRAMGELICNFAPEAELYFWSAFNGLADFAAGVVRLQEEGCNVIVDDVGYSQQSTGSVSDFDLFLCPSVPLTLEYLVANCSISAAFNTEQAGGTGDPIELASTFGFWTETYVAIYLYETSRQDLANIRLKLYSFDFDLQADQGQNGVVFDAATTSPQVNTESGMAVGAAFYKDTTDYGVSPARLEFDSSWGNQALYLDADGNRLARPKMLLKPDFVAPDGTETSFLGSDNDGNGVPEFFGASAAAPHAAALAALMLQKFPGLTVDELYAKMRNSTEDMFLTQPRMARHQPKWPLPRLPGQVAKPDAKLPEWATIQQTVAERTVGPDRYSGQGFLLATLALASPVCLNGGDCCEGGQPKAAGTVCRPAAHPCDLPEVCSGNSSSCPADVGKADASVCAWRPEDSSPYGPHMLDLRNMHCRQVSVKEASKLFESADLKHMCAGLCLSGKCVMSAKDKCCLAVGQPEPGYGTGTGTNSPYGSGGYYGPSGGAHRPDYKYADEPYGRGGSKPYAPNRPDSYRPDTHGDDESYPGEAPYYSRSAPDGGEYFQGDRGADQGPYDSPSTDMPYSTPDGQDSKSPSGDEYAQSLGADKGELVASRPPSASAALRDAKGQALSVQHGNEPQSNGYKYYRGPQEPASDWFCWK